MLEEIRIQDFAIIDELRVEFGPGLNVLTGETGAGKSIVIDALGFVLGARASTTVVRHGARATRVEAAFHLAEGDLPAAERDEGPEVPITLRRVLEEAGVSLEGADLLLSRELTAGGRNTWRLNGQPVTPSVIRDLGDVLVEIHGQHEHQGLMTPARHLDLLDRLGGPDVAKLRDEHAVTHRRWKAQRAERDELVAQERERERRREWLAFEVDEIESARLVTEPDELETLESERTVLASADRIRQRVAEALSLLEGGESGRGEGARDHVGRVARLLAGLTALDVRSEGVATAAESVRVALEDLYHELVGYADRVEVDPQRLEEVQERLEAIRRLQRKYGATIPDIVEYGVRARAELEKLEGCEERRRELEQEIDAIAGDLARQAQGLHEARSRVASSLELQVASELEGLEMRGTQFVVRSWMEPSADGVSLDGVSGPVAISPSGADHVEFLISANPGQPPQPLVRIASGGELSRVMLAIQSVLASVDPVGTMIFDEVDAGLGGVAAEAVAARLQRIAESRQVICVTHLPLVAAAAHTHWNLSKEVRDGRTRTNARSLSEPDRAREIARMLAGKQASDTTVRQAEELLGKKARSPKKPVAASTKRGNT